MRINFSNLNNIFKIVYKVQLKDTKLNSLPKNSFIIKPKAIHLEEKFYSILYFLNL